MYIHTYITYLAIFTACCSTPLLSVTAVLLCSMLTTLFPLPYHAFYYCCLHCLCWYRIRNNCQKNSVLN